MSNEYFTILTDKGRADLVASHAGTNIIELSHIALGDGGGSSYEPQASQSSLRNELLRVDITKIKQDENNPPWLVIDALIPADQGGFMIREVGVFDKEGDLFAISKYPETYKPVLEEGFAADLTIRMILEIGSSENITLMIDPSIINASKQYVDSKIETIKPLSEQEILTRLIQVDGHESGLDADMLDGRHASSFVLKSDLLSDGDIIENLKANDGAGSGIDADFLDGIEASEFLLKSELAAGSILAFAGATPPSGWLKCNGALLSRISYSDLFAAIGILYGNGDGSNTFSLPDLRGEFIRGFDDNRGIDNGRLLGSWQKDELKSHSHYYFEFGGGGYSSYGSQATSTDSGGSFYSQKKLTSVSGSNDTRPRNLALNYIIKY